ncbi:uncharacterized protein LOC131037306 [Cryptomeria japonica]|uniref:uncharacterized protein LOC131037306 n=1 Tax=Cryptomeria japonica TaxID=3369 RepID=UPI0025AC74BC|nr:uncharacterized protein LOC131037306 [Cryptomeria japonica]
MQVSDLRNRVLIGTRRSNCSFSGILCVSLLRNSLAQAFFHNIRYYFQACLLRCGLHHAPYNSTKLRQTNCTSASSILSTNNPTESSVGDQEIDDRRTESSVGDHEIDDRRTESSVGDHERVV